jgi:hypothetical protein
VSGDELFATVGPRSSRWQLPSSTDRSVMIGWHLAAGRGVDGGVPAAVAQLLARALTRSAWVSFFDASEPARSSQTRVRRLEASGLGPTVRAMAHRFPRSAFVISTRLPEVAQCAFDATLFSWELQGQVLLLTAPDVPAPAIDWSGMWSLTGREVSLTPDVLRVLQADALVFPGVDGCVMGLVSAKPEIEARVLEDLKIEAGASAFTWRMLDENEFNEAL